VLGRIVLSILETSPTRHRSESSPIDLLVHRAPDVDKALKRTEKELSDLRDVLKQLGSFTSRASRSAEWRSTSLKLADVLQDLARRRADDALMREAIEIYELIIVRYGAEFTQDDIDHARAGLEEAHRWFQLRS
jgi:hypothetical protein